MRKIFSYLLVLFTITIYAQSDSDVLMTVNGKDVSVGEFRYIYEKNNGKDADYSKKSIDEYLDLYTKFKLKVEKARELKLDTISSLKEELAGYKRQLANSYLMDKEITVYLVKELYDRVKQDVRFSHIMISLSEKSSQKDWDAGLEKINKISKELENGKSFEQAVSEYSEDKGTKDKGGDLGFFTAMMPTGFSEMEAAIYNTPVGKISKPIKSKIGYHIIKVTEKRPARGQIEVAHILIRKDDPKIDAKTLINEVYSKLKGGADFTDLVSEFSQDKQTSKAGGLLKPFGIGTYEAIFENAAFGLEKDGDYSEPIETKAGWHILKRVRRIDPAGESYAQFKKINEARVKKDDRFEAERKKLIGNIKKSAGYKENGMIFEKFVATLNDTFLTYKWTPELSADLQDKELLSIGGNYKTTLKEFAEYCKKNTRTRLKFDKTQVTANEVARMLLDDFSDEKTIEFEQANLEMKYPDFKALMREYEEGILLFEATKQAVWDKANTDTIGLEKFYDMHGTNYVTDEKAKIVTLAINTTDKKTVDKIEKFAEKNSVEDVMKKFNKKEAVISYQDEVLEKNNVKFGGMDWKTGAMTKPELNPKTNVYQFKKIGEIFPSRPKTLKEARGYVVADYQDYLEKNWVEGLRKEYAVNLNQSILSKLIK